MLAQEFAIDSGTASFYAQWQGLPLRYGHLERLVVPTGRLMAASVAHHQRSVGDYGIPSNCSSKYELRVTGSVGS